MYNMATAVYYFNKTYKELLFMGTSNVQTYHQSTSNQNTVKLRELLKTMPSFSAGIIFAELNRLPQQRHGLVTGMIFVPFFRFLLSENPSFKNAQMTVSVLVIWTAPAGGY